MADVKEAKAPGAIIRDKGRIKRVGLAEDTNHNDA
jgi:hypothetical protein